MPGADSWMGRTPPKVLAISTQLIFDLKNTLKIIYVSRVNINGLMIWKEDDIQEERTVFRIFIF